MTTEPTHVYVVSEIRDGVLRRTHGYFATLKGAFGYCETEERKKPLIDTVRFELFPAPGGRKWLLHMHYGPKDDWPETSDFVISQHEVITGEAYKPAVPQPPADRAAEEAHPSHHRWCVEHLDGVAGEWVPGTRFLNRQHAVERYQAISGSYPTWKDGTPVQRRLVRETTSYTVEDPHRPADGEQS